MNLMDTQRGRVVPDYSRVDILGVQYTSVNFGTSDRGTTRADDAQGPPTQSHISPTILVYEENQYTSIRW